LREATPVTIPDEAIRPANLIVAGQTPVRRGKKTICGTCGTAHRGGHDRRHRRVRDLPCADYRIYLDLKLRRVDCRQRGAMRRERLDLLVENALHTKRFALCVGRRYRSGTIRDVAPKLPLDWQSVKRLEMDYMLEQIPRSPDTPNHRSLPRPRRKK
jgi:transposase